MTGYRSAFFRHDCVRRGCYITQLPAWDDLISCFPRRIRPTDVDGFVEINGHFLFLEEKREGVALSDEGQRRALSKLAKHDRVTVLFFRPKGERVEVLVLGQGPAKGWQEVSREQLKNWLRWWAATADDPSLPRLGVTA